MAIQRKLEGLSFPINLSLILINLCSLFFTIFGFRNGIKNIDWLSVGAGSVFLFVSVSGVFVFKGRQFYSHLVRWLIGSFFILSAFFKLADFYSFQLYLKEVFSPDVSSSAMRALFSWQDADLGFFSNNLRFWASFIVIAQLTFGTLMFVGGLKRLTNFSVLVLILFTCFFTMNHAVMDVKKGFWRKHTYSTISKEGKKLEKRIDTPKFKVLHYGKTHIVAKQWMEVKLGKNMNPSVKWLRKISAWNFTKRHYFLVHLFVLGIAIIVFWGTKHQRINTVTDNWFTIPLANCIFLLLALFFGTWLFLLYFNLLIIFSLWIYRSWGKRLANHWTSFVFLIAFSFSMVQFHSVFFPNYIKNKSAIVKQKMKQ